MNASHGTGLSTNQRLRPMFVVFGVLLLLLTRMPALGSAEFLQLQEKGRINGKPLADKEPPEERISIAERGPTGNWSGSFIPDLRKSAANSPVVVIGTRTLRGNSEIRNLQLTHVTLKNYSSRTVLGVQLKWLVSPRLERTSEIAPAQYTGLFEARLAPGETKEVESPVIIFSRAVKTLINEGSLDGQFVVQVLAYQVEFEDGSTWNDDWGGPKPGERGEPWHGPDAEGALLRSFLDINVPLTSLCIDHKAIESN